MQDCPPLGSEAATSIPPAGPIHEISLTRAIQAPPARVYPMFTSAAGWCAWCCESAEAEAQLGGKLHIYTEGYNAYGEFTLLEPDQTVAFTFNGDAEPPTQILVRLEPQPPATRMTFQVTVLAPEADWPGFAAFLERTWGRALDNLMRVLEEEGE